MNPYTTLLSAQIEALSPDDDDYEEKLLDVASQFQGFGQALTSFLQGHGYAGDPTDVEEKARFLRDRFRGAGVALPRDFRKWFLPDAQIKRNTAYQICFAFGLDVLATEDFFRRVFLGRGFDCHTNQEAVYYFCIKNGLSYAKAQDILERVPDAGRGKALPSQDVLYTGTILQSLNGMRGPEELIAYLTAHANDFRYNNATAIRYIQELWTRISAPGGLAAKEGRLIARFNQFEDRHKKGDSDTRSQEVIAKEVRHQETEVWLDDFATVEDGASTWAVLSQMLGMSNQMAGEYPKKYGRSLNEILSRSALLPLRASYCFPNQHNIDLIMRGELGDNEMMRKLLILLAFYAYWAKLIIKKDDAYYFAAQLDADRCLETINSRLLDAGYPELYAGNPYDWLFLWALHCEHPLEAFRSYMGEVFAIHSEQMGEGAE